MGFNGNKFYIYNHFYNLALKHIKMHNLSTCAVLCNQHELKFSLRGMWASCHWGSVWSFAPEPTSWPYNDKILVPSHLVNFAILIAISSNKSTIYWEKTIYFLYSFNSLALKHIKIHNLSTCAMLCSQLELTFPWDESRQVVIRYWKKLCSWTY